MVWRLYFNLILSVMSFCVIQIETGNFLRHWVQRREPEGICLVTCMSRIWSLSSFAADILLFLYISSPDPIIRLPLRANNALWVTGRLLGNSKKMQRQYAHLYPLISLGTVSCHKWIFWQKFFIELRAYQMSAPAEEFTVGLGNSLLV